MLLKREVVTEFYAGEILGQKFLWSQLQGEFECACLGGCYT